MQINAQELPQRTAKTFANTQFDLDPNLPFDDHTTAASESSDISRRKSFISVKIQPATATPLLQTTTIAQEVMQVKPKSSKSKFQYQNVRNPSRKAPRAKPYYIVTSDVSNFIQTEIKAAEIPSNQLQSTIEKQKLSTKIIRNAETNSSNQVPLLQTLKIPPVRKGNSIAKPLLQNSPSSSSSSLLSPLSSPLSSSLSSSPSSSLLAATTPSSIPVAIRSTASGNIGSRSVKPTQQQISSHSQWFNDTLPSFGCSQDFHQIATEFQRKFPPQTTRDIKQKRLAEIIKQRLIDCDNKSKNNLWHNVMKLLSNAKLSLSEKEGCKNGLVQERIACVNLLSYTCQFIARDYTFRLVPARVIIQEARLTEDGAAKCAKVIRLIKKQNKPKSI
uniref:Uncharacterized protein n=1 Tax=Onchocerca volvulus TaxID=6282 RepID=A0A8R1U0W6_ONCVO